jgi:hypothetical protein
MGEKEKARQAMKKAKVPILPGSEGVLQNEEEALAWARRLAFLSSSKPRRAAADAACASFARRRSCPSSTGRAHRGGERLRQRRPVHGEIH